MLERLHYDNDQERASYYIIISLIAIVLALLWCVFIDAKPFSDFKYYYDLAVEISQGKPWGDTYTSVGYPIILGLVFKIFGDNIRIAQAFNLILTLVNYLLVYKILSLLSIDVKLKKITFTLFALFPLNIYYNILVGTEVLFTNIILWCTYIYMKDFKGKYLLLGALTALNTMVKPFFILYALLLFIVNFVSTGRFIFALKKSLLVFITAMILLSPWLYRNTKLTGEPTWVSNNGGIVLYINNNSQNKRGTWMAAEDVENSIVKTEEYKNANATAKNKMLGTAAKEWIKAHPKEFMKLSLLRLKMIYFDAGDSYYTTYDSNLSNIGKDAFYILADIFKKALYYPGIVFLIIYSIYIVFCILTGNARLLNHFTVYSLVLFYMITCVYLITEGQPRYSFPLAFIMIYLGVNFYNKTLLFIKERF